MTQEEIRDQVVGLQNTAKQIKEQVGMLRSNINKLMGEIKWDGEADRQKAYQEGEEKGYLLGLAEGLKQKAVEDDEIRVGDEVIAALTDERGTAVVTHVSNKKEARYIYADGTTGWDDISEVKKTGRHFPEVTKMLEAMRK